MAVTAVMILELVQIIQAVLVAVVVMLVAVAMVGFKTESYCDRLSDHLIVVRRPRFTMNSIYQTDETMEKCCCQPVGTHEYK